MSGTASIGRRRRFSAPITAATAVKVITAHRNRTARSRMMPISPSREGGPLVVSSVAMFGAFLFEFGLEQESVLGRDHRSRLETGGDGHPAGGACPDGHGLCLEAALHLAEHDFATLDGLDRLLGDGDDVRLHLARGPDAGFEELPRTHTR